MKRFIHRENLRLLRDKLVRTTNDAQCKQIVRLIEEEDLNYNASENEGDNAE